MAVQINVAANQAALTASIQAGVQAYNQRFAQNNQLNLTVNQRAFSQPLGRMTGDVKDFEAALAASNARVIAFGASTAVLGGVIRSFKELANVTIEVEKNLADINRVFGLTTSQLQKFSTDLFNVTKQTASSFNDASQAALEFSRQGLKAEETLQRTKDALTLTRLAGISTANAVDALTSTVNGFAATGVTTSQILNKLVAVEQDFAVGAGDLAEALSRTGQAAQEAGVSLDQLNALVTSAQQSTARGGAVIGNALKTIFTRLQRTETLDQLEAFNIAVRDVQGNILPAVTILQNFAGAYRGLADAQRAQLSEQVAGVYQVNILKAIVNDLNKSQGTYAGALQRGAAATNEAEVATAKLNQTLDALLKQTATSTQQLANNIGKVTFEPLAKYGTEQLKSFVESMNEILEGEGVGSTFANGLLKGIRNVIAGPGAIAAFFTLFKLIQNSFTYLAQALPQIAGITTETQNRKNIEQSILQIMQQQGPASQALAGLMGNQAAQAQLLLQIARQQTAEYQTQSTLAKQLAAQLATQGVRVKGSGGLQVTRAGGYIPAATRMAEVVGAQAGGYAPGRVVSSPVGGVMNTAEDVKYIPGFAQPFINPPAGSKAGRAHRQNAISRTGVDPYMFRGFIPNFVSTSLDAIKLNNNKVVRERTDFFDNFTANINPVELNKSIDQYTKEAANIVDSVYVKVNQRKATDNPSPYNRDALAGFIKQYKGKVSSSTLKRTSTALKNPDNWLYAQNQVKGLLGEADAKNLFENSKVTQENDFFDLIKGDGSLAEVRTRSKINKKDILVKAILERLKMAYYKNGENESINLGSYDVVIPKGSTLNSQGFIPNFATPMSTASIPWFKKYSSKYKNAAGDADLFKMGDFPTYGRGLDHEYAKKGNSAMLSYLHEDFVRSALNIALGSKKVIRPAEVGFKDKPVSDIANENDFDLLYRIADGSYDLLELKQDFKNISGSVSGFMNKKLENAKKDNPELVKKVRSMIAVSNRPKFTDPTGRNAGANFSEFEMAAASIVKDKYSNVDPSISAKLTKVTDGLLRRYEAKKNTTYDGFIPNFAYKQAVMGLEESMSGNKAIFDTKPFPHIRNSGQPTFSSAIADHGGLGNALSDSMRGQKAAGLMNKGLIPNFAGPRSIRRNIARNQARNQNAQSGFNPNQLQLDAERVAQDVIKKLSYAYNFVDGFVQTFITEVEDLSKSAKNNLSPAISKAKSSIASTSSGISSSFSGLANKIKSPEFNKTLSGAFNNIGIFGPLIAGQLESFVIGNKKRTEMTENERMLQSGLSTGLTALTTGADIGNRIFPGLGGAVGAVVGGLVGLTSALGAVKLSAEELMQLNQEQAQKTQANISAASSYIEAQKSLTQMIASGASSFDIDTAAKKLSDNFNQIKDVKLQEIFNATGGDIALMTKQLQDYTDEATKKGAFETALISKGNAKDTAKGLSFLLSKQEREKLIADMRGIENAKKISAVNAQNQAAIAARAGGFAGGVSLGGDKGRSYVANIVKELLKSKGFDEKDKNFASKLDSAIETFLSLNIEEFENEIKNLSNNKENYDFIAKLNAVSTKSFARIFQEIEQSVKQASYDISYAFEKESSSRRIQASILDFSMNFQDSVNSFISNNLPDVRKFDFTAATAGQKAEMLLQKSQQDYNKAIAEQTNEANIFNLKNSESLVSSFKESMKGLPSQVNAEFFRKEVLPDIQKGTFSGDADSVLKKVNDDIKLKAINEGQKVNRSNLQLDTKEQIGTALSNAITDREAAAKIEGGRPEILDDFINSLNELQKSTSLYTNIEEKQKLNNFLQNYNKEKETFELKQANAKKELEINKQLSEAKIAVEKDIAIEKAKVDKANLARMESMKNLSATIGNRLDISKAESGSRVAAFQRQLNDPTQTYGMGTAQITERRIKLQSDILKEQRTAEDQAINAEIQQRMLEMAAEQENTAATLKLNDTIMALIETQLRGALGGTGNIEKIFNTIQTAGPQEVDNVYGAGTYAQYQALQRIEESRTASAANNPVYNSKTFEDAMAKAGFNNVGGKGMSELEQRNFLSAEQLKAEQAGNVVLANTIRRYREQIDAKQQVLNITRKQIDADVQLQATTDRQLSTIRGRIAKGFGELNDEGDKLVLNLGENLPRMFADGMVNGIKAAIKESDNLGDALMGVAANFLDSVSTTLMQAGTYKILGGLGFDSLLATKQTGGLIRAQSGMYVSGTGSGDKYPAMLENGEYVLNRRAVMAMGGPAALDTLNFSAAPRFAAGGQFKNQLDSISSMEANMTEMGLESSPLYKEITDAAKQKAEEDRRKKLADKQQRAAMIGSLVAAAATVAIGAGISNVAQNAQATKAKAFSSQMAETRGSNPLMMSGKEFTQLQKFQSSNLISPTGFSYIGGTPQTGFRSLLSSPVRGQAWYQKAGSAISKPFRRQTGGLIGSRLSDTIPGYMEGGLYNSPMVKRYGTGMQGGGSSIMAAGNNSSTVNNNTSANNSFNFNTTVQRDGTIKMGSNATSYEQQDVELSKNLNNKIYAAVGEVIRKEKQFGGSLAGVRS